MGVKHLQNFMTEDLPGGFFEVNMKKEIEAYKK